MTELIETRSTRSGQDRVYVETPDGVSVGYVDLAAGRIVAEAEGFDETLADCLRRWTGGRSSARDTVTIRPLEGVNPVLPATLKVPWTPDVPPSGAGTHDLAGVAPGATAWARRNSRPDALAEEEVAHELEKLGTGWSMLHSVPLDDRGHDIDHLLIGPPGVVTVTTARMPNGSAVVQDHQLRVDGRRTDLLRRARQDGERVSRALTAAHGRPVPVTAVIVFVGLRELAVERAPVDVHVTTRPRVLEWLRSLPTTLQPGLVEVLYSHARLTSTWR